MKHLLLSGSIYVGLALPAHAVQIISFGQSSTANTVVATANGTDTATTIQITDAAVLIDQLFGVVTPPAIAAIMDLTATSNNAATPVGATGVLQNYDGTFCITSGAGCTGTNYLSGNFTDAAFGNNGGTQLSINVAKPPDTLNVSSSVVNPVGLGPPSSFTLSLSSLTPPLQIVGTTIGSFDASFAGLADAGFLSIPEPASLALLSFGLPDLRWCATPQVDVAMRTTFPATGRRC
jgi:hypothetical protein